MKLFFFLTVKDKVIISLFETGKLSVFISPRNLYNSLKSIKENTIYSRKIFCLQRDSNPGRRHSRQVLNLLTYCTGKGAPAALWVRRFLTKLDPGSNPVEDGILSDCKQVNGVRLHMTYHYQPAIVLI